MSSYTSFNTLLLSPFWFVAVLPVAILVCRHFGQDNLSPFWRVTVLVCRHFDHTPPCLDVGNPTAKIEYFLSGTQG